jgi:outer membrane lipoprotein-sorting protein
MLKHLIYLFGILIIQSGFTSSHKEDESLDSVILKMMEETQNISKLTFQIKNCERIGSEMKCGKQQVSLLTKPFKCHINMLHPDKGNQIVYNKEVSKKATYIPKGFPYINVTLDPLGSQMRKNNHHSIYELGFGFFTQLINHYYLKHESSFTIKKVIIEKKTEYHISSTLKGFKYVKHIVLKGETARTIAKKKFVSEHLILEKNKERSSYQVGDTILIPNQYYQKLNVVVEGENYTPKFIEVFDDKGLLEKYEFSKLNINPVFTEQTFKD